MNPVTAARAYAASLIEQQLAKAHFGPWREGLVHDTFDQAPPPVAAWLKTATDLEKAAMVEDMARIAYEVRAGRVPEVETECVGIGYITIGDRRWSTPIVNGAEGSAYPYHVFLWGMEGYGSSPEEALHMLREEMISVPVEDRDDQGEVVSEDQPFVEVREA